MAKAKMTATEMFDELIRMGYVTPVDEDPISLLGPSAYISVPTVTSYSTPPVPELAPTTGNANAKLGPRPKRNSKRKK